MEEVFLSSNIKLPLSQEEKSILRKTNLKMSDIHTFNTEEIADLLDIPVRKAETLKGLADFQTVPSIGYKLAENLVVVLNIFGLSEIKDKDGAKLFDQLEQELAVRIDSCVEDQIRCVINYTNNPTSSKHWFDFTDERKTYRELVGFPENRPKKAW
ncbi:helix-hairpin-helix domain-containing protein [Pontibacillus yanchengensis]|uniref:helix-hairpin-helix domain-containing protein n=1 Tax=Pontibacillus yanchengensis TaxID=462910 RepID=UPI00055B7548|nr:helix-hairpin-helix domain-containing protein [Pontibacillus yanchengensis]